MNDRIKVIQDLFLEAIEIEDAEKRSAFLAERCGSDLALREELEELIHAEAAAGPSLPGESLLTAPRATMRRAVEAMTSARDEPSSLITEKAGDRIGRYKLHQKIGEGGCGVVYLAEQEEPVRREVALKVIKLGMDTKQVIARFEAERQTLALMEHPNIAKVLDAGATGAGRPFFVMELVRGVKITEYCHRNKLSTRACLELFVQVCQAVQHAHQKGVIHRDLKPSNILVTVNDGAAVPKVIDFGIAKATEGRLSDHTLFTALDQVLGTPAYMSPEQAAVTSLDVDTRSDIYSLGVLLYELLTGTTPFDTRELLSAGLDELRRTIREKEPPRPSTRLTESASTARQLQQNIHLIRGDLDWIVMKCLEKDRARRYETANGLARDIKRHLSNEPVIARPPSRLYELQKLCRRHKAGFAAAGAIAVAVLAGGIVSTWQAVMAEREREHVQRNIVRQYVANGSRLMDAGDLFGSLLWFTEALRLEAGDPGREEAHRIRIASVLKQCPKLLTVLSHGDMMYHAQFSPDGTKVVTASSDHTARVWDAATGQRLLVLPHDDQVYDASFSADGAWIITSCRDGRARVWNSADGRLTRTLPHNGTVWLSCFSQDGKRVAIASETNAQVWNLATGQREGGALEYEDVLCRPAFSANGLYLGAGYYDGQGCLWNTSTGKRVLFGPAEVGGLSPDGAYFLTGHGNNLRVWDVATLTELPYSPLKLANAPLEISQFNSASFSPDGSMIVASSDGFTAQVWDAKDGQPLFSPAVKHNGPILDSKISPDGRRFATAGQDAVAQVWSTATGQPVEPPLKLILHVKYIEFNKDGRRLLANSCDQAARIWDMAKSEQTDPPRPTFENEERIFSPDGQFVLLSPDSKTVSISDARSKKSLLTLSHTNRVRYASFSRDGRTVITACSEDNLVSSTRSDIYLWDASSGRRINHSPMSQAFFLLYAAFSRDNRRILTCGFNFTARVWDANSGEPLTPPLRHKEQIRWGAFSPDGRQVVTASWDRTARVWDATTGNPITPPLQHSETVVGAFWSEDGKRLSTLTKDDRLQVWDLQTGEPLTPPRRVGDQPSQFSETLPMDNRPVKDLVQLAQMLSVGKIDADGNVVPLQLQELKSEWQTLHEKYPAQFSAAPTEIAAWHQRQARESASEGNERAEKFHLAMMAQAGAAIGSYEPSPPPSRFPPRDTATPRQQIDLSAFYNEGLHDSGGYDFGDLRPGPFEAGGVEFDLRGMVLLDGQKARRQKAGLPVRANGIRIGQKCRRLHFIQATDWAPLLNGAQIATYILHYADGGTRELPVIYGKHTAGMWVWSLFGMATPCQPMSEAIPAWTGHNVNALRSDCALWLYKSDRDNPRPDVELSSVDVVSTMSEASPLLAALTIE